ncbi:DUF4133 domain-containing protein [Mucilaginibacter robiniae]|uniref:DUF4133 domain-containing protein n=1 Tax=Mucilaginibacter robiniae TaxID=2728022 RepID=A0A7L5DYL0_9SPHI|nr:DUF4133 domain-containing protein [Mucilaginibacter robiniae]QJD96095.1 DUF4133 domain-containing protein [Mucilaginibacter robiniae]
MSNSIYTINKGINKSIEFQGLRAQYIWYFGAMVIVLMITFAVLYICGAPTYICLPLVGGAGVTGSIRIFAWSHQYGEHGLMKVIARKRLPRVLKSYTRRNFQHLSGRLHQRQPGSPGKPQPQTDGIYYTIQGVHHSSSDPWKRN